ncbi:MAG: disulfide bond formation protein DsbA [Arcobacter sp.]|uniref:DsbA family protein n=1 Tax=uncultured Arcobacter sp. TaxID=165434 RepID=UPI000CB53532|nr:thioredoxin domain-containing protein [uncultured Arcobacter sp.]PLY08568.1 MAG: disulfide bond formation protein DsbA [Arcobacter sp.]
MRNLKKVLMIFSIFAIGLYANDLDKDIINFEKKRLSNNARVEIQDVKINTKLRMKMPINNWYGYIIDVKAKVKDKEINAKDIVFSNGVVVAADLLDLKTGKSLKDLLEPKFDTKYYSEKHLIAGNHKAKDKVVVFSDPLCPFCMDYVPDVIEHVNKNEDSIALYYYHFPLLRVHPASATLVKAMNIAKSMNIKDVESKVYQIDWDRYFKVDSKDEEEILKAFNKEFNIEITKEELNNPTIMNSILEDVKIGEELMVRGTPTIFVNGEKDNTKLKYETLGDR